MLLIYSFFFDFAVFKDGIIDHQFVFASIDSMEVFLPPLSSGVMMDSFSIWLYSLSVMTDFRKLKVVSRQAIGL